MARKVPFGQMASALSEQLEKFGRTTLEDAAESVSIVADGAEAKAVELAPVDKGNLEASSVVDVLKSARKVVARIAFTTPYAAEVHELPDEARGPKTRLKPGNELGPAGPKYLERVLRALQVSAARDIGQALQRLWRGL